MLFVFLKMLRGTLYANASDGRVSVVVRKWSTSGAGVSYKGAFSLSGCTSECEEYAGGFISVFSD